MAANHARALVQHGAVEHLVLAVGAWQKEMYQSLLGSFADRIEIVSVDIKNSSLARNRWFATDVPSLARKFSSSLVHHSFPVPVFRKLFACPIAVTLHDLYPYDLPSNFGFPNYFVNRMILRQCIHNVDGIACVSSATRSRLDALFPEAARLSAIEVTGNYVKISDNGLDSLYRPKGVSDTPFILCVAQHRKNKNLDLLIRGFAKFSKSNDLYYPLVIVGARGPETRMLGNLVKELDIVNKTMFLDSIADDELRWLYRNCALFVVTSGIEGFCLPVAEALLHHARVLCSDIPILKDVAEDEANYFSLVGDAVRNLATAMSESLRRPAATHDVEDRFSDKRVLAAYLRLYSRILAARA